MPTVTMMAWSSTIHYILLFNIKIYTTKHSTDSDAVGEIFSNVSAE